MPDILLYAATTTLYAALAWYFWRTRWVAPAPGRMRPWERAALVVPLVLHGWLLARELLVPPELRFGFALALSVMLWLGILIYFIESFFFELPFFVGGVLSLLGAAIVLRWVPETVPSRPRPT